MMERLERVDPGVTGSTIDKDKTVGSAVTHCFSVAVADVTMDHLKEVRWTGNRVFVTACFLDVSNATQFQGGFRWMDEGEIGLAGVQDDILSLEGSDGRSLGVVDVEFFWVRVPITDEINKVERDPTMLLKMVNDSCCDGRDLGGRQSSR